jgi:hypothetical protein
MGDARKEKIKKEAGYNYLKTLNCLLASLERQQDES